MVIAKDMIYFALVDEDSVVDCIPLHEISQIKRMGLDGGTEQVHSTHAKSFFQGSSHLQLSSNLFFRTVRVDTHPDGYNSGRTYYLQASSDEELTRLNNLLTDYTKDARKRYEAKSVLERSQTKVRKFFHSPGFQCAAAFFILAVRAARAAPRTPCAGMLLPPQTDSRIA
jgi:hypothetical protein